MPSDKTCCVPGCSNNRGVSQEVLHGFPSPITEFERFNTWKIIIGAHIFESLSDEHIMKYRRVCRKHFELKYLCRYNRISSIAVPTINVQGKYQPNSESKPVETPLISNAKPVDNPTITTTIEVAKPVSDCKVAQADSPTINTDISTNVATEVVISDSEEEIKTVPALHSYKICDNCNKKIVGFRYKCLSCVDYNHCHNCEMQEAHPNHYMIRMPKSPEYKLSDIIIDKICDEFKAACIICSEENQRQENMSCNYEAVNNNSEDCDSDIDLPEDVKLLISKEVRDKLVDKTNLIKTGKEKIKRKKNFPNDVPKKRMITVKTNSINDEALQVVGISQNSNDPNLVTMNVENSDACGRENNERSSTIATVVTDAVSSDVVYMKLNDVVTQLILEMTKDGKKIIYKYVDS